MLKDWTVEQVYELCFRIVEATKSKHYNKHAQWLCKQDLYRIKWVAEQALAQCEAFDGEEDFIKSYEHKKLLKAIKGDDSASR